jgi:hypothetical protein
MNTSTKSLQLLSLLIADFCNKIGTTRKGQSTLKRSGHWCRAEMTNGVETTHLIHRRRRLPARRARQIKS